MVTLTLRFPSCSPYTWAGFLPWAPPVPIATHSSPCSSRTLVCSARYLPPKRGLPFHLLTENFGAKPLVSTRETELRSLLFNIQQKIPQIIQTFPVTPSNVFKYLLFILSVCSTWSRYTCKLLGTNSMGWDVTAKGLSSATGPASTR